MLRECDAWDLDELLQTSIEDSLRLTHDGTENGIFDLLITPYRGFTDAEYETGG
jgi:hypothetical protein